MGERLLRCPVRAGRGSLGRMRPRSGSAARAPPTLISVGLFKNRIKFRTTQLRYAAFLLRSAVVNSNLSTGFAKPVVRSYLVAPA